MTEIRPAIPRELARIVHRCLEKKPADRYQSALDLRHSLEETKEDLDSGDLLAIQSAPARRRPIAAGIALLGATTAAAVWTLTSIREAPSGIAVPRLQNAVQVTSALDVESYPTWSPDGGRLAYQASDSYVTIGNHDIFVAQLGSGEPVNLTQDSPANDRMPSWSPDGREIAFFSDRDGTWGLYTVSAIGGNPRHVLRLPGISAGSWSAPRWSSDGTRLHAAVRQASENVLITLSLASLDTTRVRLPDHEGDVCWELSVSPDGRRFAYVAAGGGGPEIGRLWTVGTSGEDAVPLTDGLTMVRSPTWSQDGATLFCITNRGGSMDLWQQTVAPDGAPVGEPLAITQGVGIRSAAFSPNGEKLAYTRGGIFGNVWRVPMFADRPATWADAQQLTSERAYIEFVDVSADGRQLAVSSDRRGNQDLWRLPVAGGEMTPVTTDPAPDWHPRWSPDGRELAFYSARSGNRDIWVMPSQGGPARQLTFHPGRDWFPTWSPDGREIAFHVARPEGEGIAVVDPAGREPHFVAPGGGVLEWTPDGRALVVLRPPDLYRVSRDAGQAVRLPRTVERPGMIRFSRDGQSLYYSVNTGPREQHGIWKLSLPEGRNTRIVTLEGRRGRFGYGFAVEGQDLYVTWNEHEGDLWVMDVVPANSSRPPS